LPWENTNEFIRSGHRDPAEFQKETLKTISLNEGEGIKAVVGKPKGKDSTEVIVDITGKTTTGGGANQRYLGLSTVAGSEMGLAWTDSTTNSTTLYRGANDVYWNYVRVRVWKID
jgi:hypothetical protein